MAPGVTLHAENCTDKGTEVRYSMTSVKFPTSLTNLSASILVLCNVFATWLFRPLLAELEFSTTAASLSSGFVLTSGLGYTQVSRSDRPTGGCSAPTNVRKVCGNQSHLKGCVCACG